MVNYAIRRHLGLGQCRIQTDQITLKDTTYVARTFLWNRKMNMEKLSAKEETNREVHMSFKSDEFETI